MAPLETCAKRQRLRQRDVAATARKITNSKRAFKVILELCLVSKEAAVGGIRGPAHGTAARDFRVSEASLISNRSPRPGNRIGVGSSTKLRHRGIRSSTL